MAWNGSGRADLFLGQMKDMWTPREWRDLLVSASEQLHLENESHLHTVKYISYTNDMAANMCKMWPLCARSTMCVDSI